MTSAFIFGGISFFLLLLILDRRFPLRRASLPILRRLLPNVVLSLLAFAAVRLVVQPAIRSALGWTADKQFGLLHMVNLPSPAAFVFTFLWFDFTFYLWHRMNHVVPLLWRFHNVHHLDPDLDISTSFRFHFGEIALSSFFRAVQIFVVGPTFLAYAVYETAFQLETIFQHSNLRLPIESERRLSRYVVTPRMHGIHHSEILEENRSNFSTVFSVWDRLFSTLRLNIPQAQVVIGVPAFTEADNTIGRALSLPFTAQPDYWKRSDGTAVLVRAETPTGRREELAE